MKVVVKCQGWKESDEIYDLVTGNYTMYQRRDSPQYIEEMKYWKLKRIRTNNQLKESEEEREEEREEEWEEEWKEEREEEQPSENTKITQVKQKIKDIEKHLNEIQNTKKDLENQKNLLMENLKNSKYLKNTHSPAVVREFSEKRKNFDRAANKIVKRVCFQDEIEQRKQEEREENLRRKYEKSKLRRTEMYKCHHLENKICIFLNEKFHENASEETTEDKKQELKTQESHDTLIDCMHQDNVEKEKEAKHLPALERERVYNGRRKYMVPRECRKKQSLKFEIN